jgi:hypothetical protein
MNIPKLILALIYLVAVNAAAQDEYNFSKGKSVYGDLRWGVVKKGGKTIVPFEYDTVFSRTSTHFSLGKLSGGIMLAGVADAKGNEVVPFRFRQINFLDNLFWAIDFEGSSVLIDYAGNEIAKGFFRDVKPDSGGVKVRTFNYWRVYNKNTIVGDTVFADSLSLRGNELLAYRAGNPYIHPFKISLGNSVVVKHRIHPCTEKFLAPDTASFKGDSVFHKYQAVLGISSGFIGVQKDNLYGFIDTSGKVRISLQYEAVGPFSEGYAPVKLTGKWGFIDADEKLVIQPQFDKVSPFCHAGARVWINGKINFTGTEGQIKNTDGYDSVAVLPTGNWMLIGKNKKGLADSSGRELIMPRYDFLSDQGDGYAIVRQNSFAGVIDYQQNFIVPFEYDIVQSDKTGWFFAGKSGSISSIRRAGEADKKKKNGK